MPTPEPQENELLEALLRTAQILNEQDLQYALIGGLGVALRGPIRTTRDVDLLLDVPQLKLPPLLESLQQQGFQLDLRACIAQWNADHLIEIRYGPIRLDWVKAVIPVFQRILQRARWETIQGRQVRVADAEGLLLLKLISLRLRDEEDIRGILAANHGALDLDWVRSEWAKLAALDTDRADKFEELVREFYAP